ncbi:hypothetical protein [Pedobacter sp. L105]|uniref:hypothetical protein n=1 Tax=Pedobacter sp. L105 TaxID=1641871 RepID=UPI00131DE635|nr:hypothetical protein [Pedobacter sp. L105]
MSNKEQYINHEEATSIAQGILADSDFVTAAEAKTIAEDVITVADGNIKRNGVALYNFVDVIGNVAAFTKSTTLGDADVDGVMVIKEGDEYFLRNISGGFIDSRIYGTIGDGLNDDTQALNQALEAAVRFVNGNLFIPKTAGGYQITSTVYNRLGSGSRINITSDGAMFNTVGIISSNTIWKITPVRECVVFSFGAVGVGNEVRDAFVNNLGTEVNLNGFTINCASIPYVLDPVSNNVDIGIGIQINAEIISTTNITIENTIGYGIRYHGARVINIYNCNALAVGLRDKNGVAGAYTGADSYGDALYFTGNKDNSIINIDSVTAHSIDTVNKRGRVGLTFEFTNAGNCQVHIKNSNLDYYAKMIHIEAMMTYKIIAENCSFTRFNALAAVALNNAKIHFVNCNVSMSTIDGYEDQSTVYVITLYQSLPDISFDSCQFDYTGISDGTTGISGVEHFTNCNFNINSKRLIIADSLKNTLFFGCKFDSFGSDIDTSSFTNYASGSSTYKLVNCLFTGNDTLRVANTDGKADLTFINCNSISLKQELLVTNKTTVINDILPFDSTLITKTRINIVGTELILARNNTGSPLWDTMKFSAIVIGADLDNSARDINRALIVAGGYWIVDYNWSSLGYHIGTATLGGTEPSGYAVTTSNGGITWSPSKTNGGAVKQIVVMYFPRYMKSYFLDV